MEAWLLRLELGTCSTDSAGTEKASQEAQEDACCGRRGSPQGLLIKTRGNNVCTMLFIQLSFLSIHRELSPSCARCSSGTARTGVPLDKRDSSPHHLVVRCVRCALHLCVPSTRSAVCLTRPLPCSAVLCSASSLQRSSLSSVAETPAQPCDSLEPTAQCSRVQGNFETRALCPRQADEERPELTPRSSAPTDHTATPATSPRTISSVTNTRTRSTQTLAPVSVSCSLFDRRRHPSLLIHSVRL